MNEVEVYFRFQMIFYLDIGINRIMYILDLDAYVICTWSCASIINLHSIINSEHHKKVKSCFEFELRMDLKVSLWTFKIS